ncbi:unnamed protein product, partial [Staurois parvus]
MRGPGRADLVNAGSGESGYSECGVRGDRYSECGGFPDFGGISSRFLLWLWDRK